MIQERLDLLSDELNTKFVFTIDHSGNMTDLNILEEVEGIPIPRFAILVDNDNEKEKYVLSILESPYTLYFGSDICETISVFVSGNIEEIFKEMKKEALEDNYE